MKTTVMTETTSTFRRDGVTVRVERDGLLDQFQLKIAGLVGTPLWHPQMNNVGGSPSTSYVSKTRAQLRDIVDVIIAALEAGTP